MHNAHYIIIQAKNEDDARYEVENELDNWGNEDNWYEVMKVVKLSNKMSDEDRKYVQGELDYLNKEVSPDSMQHIIDEIESEQAKLSDGNRFHYFTLSELYKQLYEISAHTSITPPTHECESDTFKCSNYDEYSNLPAHSLPARVSTDPIYTIEKLMECEFNTFKCDCYDEYGLTDMVYEYDEELPVFFVEINMHS